MQKNLQEIEGFWDDFAQVYEEIRQESSLPVVTDLTEFLLNKHILPCHSFLDMAGGPGNYLQVIQKHAKNFTLVDLSQAMLQIAKKKVVKDVTLVHSDQQTFLKKASPYEVVFSAMNPALSTKKDLLDLMRLATKWFLVFRLVKEEDTLFSPYETSKDESLHYNEQYKAYFAAEQIPYQSQLFTYQQTETITKDLFLDYFAETYSEAKLLAMCQRHFGEKEVIKLKSNVTYELLYLDRRD